MTLRMFTALSAALVSTALAAMPASAASMSEIVRASYPPQSLAQGEQGIAHFAVDLDEDARIESCVVTKSSGYERLDAATCDLIVLHAKFAPAETDQKKRVATTRTGRITWRLPADFAGNARLAPQPAQVTETDLEKSRLYCRRAQAAGSLIKSRAHCLTRAEWSVAEATVREEMEEFFKRTRNRP